jgi:hypothetical protein
VLPPGQTTALGHMCHLLASQPSGYRRHCRAAPHTSRYPPTKPPTTHRNYLQASARHADADIGSWTPKDRRRWGGATPPEDPIAWQADKTNRYWISMPLSIEHVRPITEYEAPEPFAARTRSCDRRHYSRSASPGGSRPIYQRLSGLCGFAMGLWRLPLRSDAVCARTTFEF